MKVIELAAGTTADAFDAMRELRPHLASVEEFVRTVDEVQRPQGYRIVAARESTDGPVLSAAGFRYVHSLSAGPFLYIDDLSTLPAARSHGYATTLLTWVADEARRLECSAVHLDSGTQRHTAHRVYLNNGFVIPALHFSRAL